MKISNEEVKLAFREIEQISQKNVNIFCNRSFNETCLNIYICTHIFDLLIVV